MNPDRRNDMCCAAVLAILGCLWVYVVAPAIWELMR